MSADFYFDCAMTFFWDKLNDGQPLHVSPHDPGGATSWGVIFKFWTAWRQQHGESYGYNDFVKQQRDDFLPYYYSQYWNACRCHDLGAVGIPVFDMAGNAGPGTAVKLLQRAIGVADDGALGPRTLAAVQAAKPTTLINSYAEARIGYYSGLADLRYFPGWIPRAKRCRDYALQILARPQPATKVTS